MALITGTPLGQINQQDDIYLDTAPTVFFQERASGINPLNNPDGDGFYWGLSGTTTYPVYELRCYDTVQWAGNIEMNNIRCDTTGDQGTIQKLNYLDLTFNLKTMFPLSTLRHILRGGAVTQSGALEKMGIGQPNNNRFYRAYFPIVYDPDTGDHVSVTIHKAQYVDSWAIAFNYGQPSTLGVTLRGYADPDLPAAQLFATVIRADPSAIS